MERSRITIKRLRHNWQQVGRYGVLLIPLAFLLVFFFYPLFSIFSLSLWPDGALDLTGFVEFLNRPRYYNVLWFTLYQAVLSTFLTLILALPGAYVITRYRFPGRSVLLSLSTLPFVLPTVVVASAFKALIGQGGGLNNLLMSIFALSEPPIQLERTLTIILIVHVFYNYAVALRMIAGYWANQTLHIEEAARVLGAHGWRLWWHVRLPLLRPAILAAAVLVFIFTFTSFGVVLILGGPRFATLEVEIYLQAANFLNLPLAAILSLIQVSIMLLMMGVYTHLQRRNTAVALQSAQHIARPPRTLAQHALVWLNILFIVVLLFTPLIALVLRSLRGRDGIYTFAYYLSLAENPRNSITFVPPVQAIGNSLVFAMMTTVLSVLLGVLTAYLLGRRPTKLTRLLDPLFMLPLATSAVTLGFGFIIALDEPPLNLRTSWILIPIAHTLVAMPFVVRSVLPVLRSIPPHMQEAAANLGASPWRIWRWIDLPLISRGIVVGATFAFTVSMGEFGASLFIARPDTPTMPIVIFRLLEQPISGNFERALALSVILMAVCAISFLIIERVRTVGVGEF